MKAYKVFRIIDGKIYSVCSHVLNNTLTYLLYNKKNWNKRILKKGPFCAFRTLDDAKKFIDKHFDFFNFKIYKVRGKKSKEKSVWELDIDKNKLEISLLPDGTILVDRFKIIKEVEV